MDMNKDYKLLKIIKEKTIYKLIVKEVDSKSTNLIIVTRIPVGDIFYHNLR